MVVTSKKHVFGSGGKIAGWAAKLLLARWLSWYYVGILHLTARQLKSGYVTRRSYPACVPFL